MSETVFQSHQTQSKGNSEVALPHESLIQKFGLLQNNDGQIQSAIDTLIIGSSPKALELKQMVQLASGSEYPVLVTGPSGCGKEVAARAIHAASDRKQKKFIALNCGAIPHDLIEAELFGHTKGSFTGAHQDRIGLFEQADGGTLFLDEIGEMPLDLQVRLLRVLEDSTIRSIGGIHEKTINVRIIAATNKEIGSLIDKEKFREDLYYRLSVLSINIPTLQDRAEDIPELVEYFVQNTTDVSHIQLSHNAWKLLSQYHWPGNIRQLRNWVSRASLFNNMDIINEQRVQILLDMGIPKTQSEVDNTIMFPQKQVILNEILDRKNAKIFDLRKYLENEEKKYMRIALREANNVVQKAVNLTSMKRTTFVEKMKRYKI